MDRQVVAYVEPFVKRELELRAVADNRTLSNYIATVLANHIAKEN